MTKNKNRPKGVSCKVTYFRASNSSHNRPRVLSTQALARERQESRNRYLHHLSGLSSSSIRILQDNTTNLSQDLDDVSMPSAEDNWEDVIGEVVAPGMQGAEEVDDIVYDLRDIASSR
ncbi:hypothetical protein C0992_001880 [Termitomyces sp. T32_za158]|nr:hypothetical protein C0992_001880 [Termitomyces sp. T32_za158]